jgi:hypothetical protein
MHTLPPTSLETLQPRSWADRSREQRMPCFKHTASVSLLLSQYRTTVADRACGEVVVYFAGSQLVYLN